MKYTIVVTMATSDNMIDWTHYINVVDMFAIVHKL